MLRMIYSKTSLSHVFTVCFNALDKRHVLLLKFLAGRTATVQLSGYCDFITTSSRVTVPLPPLLGSQTFSLYSMSF